MFKLLVICCITDRVPSAPRVSSAVSIHSQLITFNMEREADIAFDRLSAVISSGKSLVREVWKLY